MGINAPAGKQTRQFRWLRGVILFLGLLIAAGVLRPPSVHSQTSQSPPSTDNPQSRGHHYPITPADADDIGSASGEKPIPLTARQRERILRANFEKTKNDAAALATLARELRLELDKPNVNVLAAEVVERAEKIEKLAKKIRDETKGN